jgi:hypothetical protein
MSIGLLIGNKTRCYLNFAKERLLAAQADEDLEYMTRKLHEVYEAWVVTLRLTETKCVILGVKFSRLEFSV